MYSIRFLHNLNVVYIPDPLNNTIVAGAGSSLCHLMVPKVESCVHAVRAGAKAAHLLDGRVPHVLLLELFTDAGIGTMITSDPESACATSAPRSLHASSINQEPTS